MCPASYCSDSDPESRHAEKSRAELISSLAEKQHQLEQLEQERQSDADKHKKEIDEHATTKSMVQLSAFAIMHVGCKLT